MPHNLDIFGSLTAEKKIVKDRLKKKEEEKSQANPTVSKAGKLQPNKTNIQPVVTPYSQRKQRGQQRGTYNEGVTKIPGSYNENAQVEITVLKSVDKFDFLNLTATARVDALQAQYQIIEEQLKKQLKTEQFEDFYSPI